MATAQIAPLENRFVDTLTRSEALVTDIKGLVKPPPAGPGHPGLPQLQLNLVYELAFIRCILAWVDFLFTSMCAYLTGAKGTSGRAVKSKARVQTLEAAEAVLVGGQRFLSWTDSGVVRKRAQIWFDGGGPYVAALSAFASYGELRTVRNRIVHKSRSAEKSFSTLRGSKYGTSKAAKKQQHGMGPGAFLAAKDGAGTRFNAYVQDMKSAARTIAEA
ncbi:MAG: hypothetical protein QG596_196 [Actinomycetota bacterium]|nr:hypothetical protein [Actinomycetota bacterium]